MFCENVLASGAFEPGADLGAVNGAMGDGKFPLRPPPLFNTQSPAMYMDIESGFSVALKTYFNVSSYPLTPFNAMRAMLNRARSSILVAAAAWGPDSGTIEIMPYLAWKSYGRPSMDCDSRDEVCSDAYQEMIIHAGISGARKFLMWNTHARAGDNLVVRRC